MMRKNMTGANQVTVRKRWRSIEQEKQHTDAAGDSNAFSSGVFADASVVVRAVPAVGKVSILTPLQVL
jgi:hypothetical protein